MTMCIYYVPIDKVQWVRGRVMIYDLLLTTGMVCSYLYWEKGHRSCSRRTNNNSSGFLHTIHDILLTRWRLSIQHHIKLLNQITPPISASNLSRDSRPPLPLLASGAVIQNLPASQGSLSKGEGKAQVTSLAQGGINHMWKSREVN